MAMDLAINTERTQKFIEDLEAQKTTLSSCTQLFTVLTNHFTSLQQSLTLKSQSLDSKFKSLQVNSNKTLESLSQRETSIPERESAAAAKVEEQKLKALAQFEKPSKFNKLPDCLRSMARRMDASGLLKFIISKRKESVLLRAEISPAIMEAVDPARLILDAVDEFLNSKIDKLGVTDKRWACGMLVQVLFPEMGSDCFGGKYKGPEFSQAVVERAGKILGRWKDMVEEKGYSGGVVGPAEAVMFLQMVVIFGLKSRFDEEFLRKLVMENVARRDMAKLAANVGFGQKMEEMIDELVKNGKVVEAVYFASESGLTEKFPPVSLLTSYIKNFKKNTGTPDESNAMEFNSIKAVIKCVEDHNLESELSLDNLRKRVTRLERTKAEKKKSSAAAAAKSKHKRSHSATGSREPRQPEFRPSKAAKFSSNSYSQLSFRSPAPLPHHNPVSRYSGPYSYPSHSVHEGHSTTPHVSSYGSAHTQSPAGIPQQQYSLSGDDATAAGFRGSGIYGGQANYSAYDYGSGAPPAYDYGSGAPPAYDYGSGAPPAFQPSSYAQ